MRALFRGRLGVIREGGPSRRACCVGSPLILLREDLACDGRRSHVSLFRLQLSTVAQHIITAGAARNYLLAASPAIKARMETRRKVRT